MTDSYEKKIRRYQGGMKESQLYYETDLKEEEEKSKWRRESRYWVTAGQRWLILGKVNDICVSSWKTGMRNYWGMERMWKIDKESTSIISQVSDMIGKMNWVVKGGKEWEWGRKREFAESAKETEEDLIYAWRREKFQKARGYLA